MTDRPPANHPLPGGRPPTPPAASPPDRASSRGTSGRGRPPPSEPARTDAQILAAAAEQEGVVSRAQLLSLGLSQRQVQYRVETGRLDPLYRGVYAVGPGVGTRRREMAAILACGRDSWLGYWTAAGMWDLTDAPGSGKRPVTVLTRRDLRRRDPDLRICRVRRLDDDEITETHGLPLTTPARTLLDLASVADIGDVEKALHRAMPRLVRPHDLSILLQRYPRRQGRRLLATLLDAHAHPGVTRSEAERALLRLLRSAGIPLPETNVILHGYEVDCLWRTERLIVEVDGRAFHSDVRSFEGDRDRDTTLVAAGFRVMRVTWKQIHKHPRRLLVRLAGALAQGRG